MAKKSIQMKLSDKYKQDWRSEMSRMSSCILYRSFKPELKLENIKRYLTTGTESICSNLDVGTSRYQLWSEELLKVLFLMKKEYAQNVL